MSSAERSTSGQRGLLQRASRTEHGRGPASCPSPSELTRVTLGGTHRLGAFVDLQSRLVPLQPDQPENGSVLGVRQVAGPWGNPLGRHGGGQGGRPARPGGSRGPDRVPRRSSPPAAAGGAPRAAAGRRTGTRARPGSSWSPARVARPLLEVYRRPAHPGA